MREVWRELIFADEVLTTLNARQKLAFELLQQFKSQTEARTPNFRQVPGKRSNTVRRLQGFESNRK
jgi:hypothetical protein